MEEKSKLSDTTTRFYEKDWTEIYESLRSRHFLQLIRGVADVEFFCLD